MTLNELADRVYRAPGPSFQIEQEIADAVGHNPRLRLPNYMASISAATALKQPGDLWCVGSMEEGPFARVVPTMPGGGFGEEIAVGCDCSNRLTLTAPMALTAAFLRARAAGAAMEAR